MGNIEIRRAAAADAAAIAELEREIFPDAWSEDTVLSYIDSAFVATLDGETVAYLILRLIAPEGEIYRIAVSGRHRRQGIARELFSFAVSAERTRGLESLYLEVREKNAPARALYDSLGFRECGLRRGYYKNPDDNAIIMVYDDENTCI